MPVQKLKTPPPPPQSFGVFGQGSEDSKLNIILYLTLLTTYRGI